MATYRTVSTKLDPRPSEGSRTSLKWSLTLILFLGCGTNQFQQELKTEESAIKLTQETIRGDYELISTADLKKLLDSNERLVLVDAMPPDESYRKAHLPGAVNFELPKEALESDAIDKLVEKRGQEFEKLVGADKEQTIVVYCGFVKCARSHNAALIAQRLGYTHVVRYPGGIFAWRGAGYPVTDK